MADINIQITIPDEHVSRVQAAFLGLGDEKLELLGLNTGKEINILGKQVGENNMQYGKRFIRQAMWRFVKLYEQKALDDDYIASVDVINHEQDSVPEGVFT